MPDVQTELVYKLRAALSDCGLLFLVASYDLDEIVTLLRAGATGFIAHDSAAGDLARVIIAAGRGEIVLPQELATKVLVALAEFHREPIPYDMSAILDLVAEINPDLLCLDMTSEQWQKQSFGDLPPEYQEALEAQGFPYTGRQSLQTRATLTTLRENSFPNIHWSRYYLIRNICYPLRNSRVD